MDKNQKICCSVTSCKYNNLENGCELSEIQVSPIQDCDTQKPVNQCVQATNMMNNSIKN